MQQIVPWHVNMQAMNIRITGRRWLYEGCTLLEAVCMTLLRRLQSVLGRRPRPSSYDVFRGFYLRELLDRQPSVRLTCAGRTDGVGAQAHTMIAAMAFARCRGHRYVHTPFTEIAHGDRTMDEWVSAWEQLFNLGAGEEQADSAGARAMNYSAFHPQLYHAVIRALDALRCGRLRPERSGPGFRSFFQPFFYYADSHPDSYSALIPDLRKKYRCGRAQSWSSRLRVAVHMRRGDVTPEHPGRFTPVGPVGSTITQLKSLLDARGMRYRLSVYSQGAASDFIELQRLGAKLFLDADALWTMQQLVDADILVMSRSSFSYVPALISEGMKLYEPFWHPPLADWIVRERKGGFDEISFHDQLDQFLKRRCDREGEQSS
jgi:hypothetical protein